MPTINNISDYLNALRDMVNKSKEHEYFFRGHANKEWEILPAVYRKLSTSNYIAYEDRIFREIISKAPHEFTNESSAIEKLVKMQHFGIPTRLLDITSNALVALYFACIEEDEHNAEVICFEIPKERIKFYDSDQVSMLSNLAKMKIEYTIDTDYLNYESWLRSESFNEVLSVQNRQQKKQWLVDSQIEKHEKEQNSYFNWTDAKAYGPKFWEFDFGFTGNNSTSNFDVEMELTDQEYYQYFIRDFNSSEFAGYLLHEIKNEKPQFYNCMDPLDFNNIVPVKVKQSNPRIIKQSGAFLLFGIKDGNKLIPPVIRQASETGEVAIKTSSIEIPGGETKKMILQELETLGINESTLFPEIEHQAAVVKRLYS